MTTINATSSTTNGGVLGTTAASYTDTTFLQLLTAQLENQTPLNPVDDASFMNQMASYTTMSEQREMNTNLLKLLDYQGLLARSQGLSQGSALLGKEVTYTGDDGEPATGKVESLSVGESGDVMLKLDGGQEINLRTVTGIAQAAAASA